MRMHRIDQLEQYILDHKSASIEELCEAFSVSKNTLRRDLEVLLTRGNIEKVYGGVMAIETQTLIPELISYSERTARHQDTKRKLAQTAASYVQENDIIFVDTGTTTVGIVEYLGHLNAVTVITNSIQAVNLAMNYPNINLICLPGTLKRSTASLVGNACVEQLQHFNLVRAFMACTTLSAEHGICNASMEEYSIKKAVLEKSQTNYLLADHSKFGKTSLMTFGLLDQFSTLITDRQPPEDFARYCGEHQCAIVLPAKD